MKQETEELKQIVPNCNQCSKYLILKDIVDNHDWTRIWPPDEEKNNLLKYLPIGGIIFDIILLIILIIKK